MFFMSIPLSFLDSSVHTLLEFLKDTPVFLVMAFFIVWIASYRSMYSNRSERCFPSLAFSFIFITTPDSDSSSWSTHNHRSLQPVFFSYARNFV